MKNLIKPNALKAGDVVAAVSLSWGGAGALPERYAQGKRQFEDAFGVKIIEMENTLAAPELLDERPDLRLVDMMAAFQNPDVKAIITNIGGEDTIRLLRHMTDEHFEIIRANPKIFMGFSDTTANHFMCFKAGLSSFYSASLMYGYAENCGIPEYIVENTKKTLFSAEPVGVLSEAPEFILERLNWVTDDHVRRARTAGTPWRYIQGTAPARGRLLGGCAELFYMMNGTPLWPSLEDWDGAILFMETSELETLPLTLEFTLRNFGAQGILEHINGILLGRPGGEFRPGDEALRDKWVSDYPKYDDAILKVCKEYGRTDIPIVTNMDFGHTVPQLIMPIGAMTEINPDAKTVSIVDGAVK